LLNYLTPIISHFSTCILYSLVGSPQAELGDLLSTVTTVPSCEKLGKSKISLLAHRRTTG
jgi:hypothetical protein